MLGKATYKTWNRLYDGKPDVSVHAITYKRDRMNENEAVKYTIKYRPIGSANAYGQAFLMEKSMVSNKLVHAGY